MRTTLILAVITTVFTLAPPVRADDEWPAHAADSRVGKSAIRNFEAMSAAMAKKVLEPTELLSAQKASEDCLSDAYHITSVMKDNHGNAKLYDEDKQIMPTSAGDITLKEFIERCKKATLELRNRKAVGCGFKDVSVQQEKLSRDKWGSLDDFVSETYKASPCSAMPKKSAFPGASKTHEGRFKQMCGKGAIYVIEDRAWSTYDRDGRVFRSIGGKCWERGELNFGT